MQFLYHDQDLTVIIKPVGMDSESAVPAAIQAALGGECYTVHRLDLNVGGVMVYARTKAAAAALSRAIQGEVGHRPTSDSDCLQSPSEASGQPCAERRPNGTMVKEYVALIHGTVDESGDWTDLLLKDVRKNKVFVVDRMRKGVKDARLAFTRLDTNGETSLVRIRLYTGRSHQIRVQFASRKHPLVGDHKYGARDTHDAPMLFSYCLTFPWKGKTLRFEHLPDWAMLPEADLARIAAMEEAFNRRAPEDLPVLAAYLDGGQWQMDYEADEQGRIPKDVKRGVLSQDGLYNLISEWENRSKTSV